MRKKEYYTNGIRMIPTETEEQIAVFSWAALNLGRFPELELMHHVPNGGKRSKPEAARFRAMGVKAGVCDIFLPVSRWGYHGLYIEMKALDGRVSREQDRFITAAQNQGYYCRVCYGADEAILTLEMYLTGGMPE